MAQPLVKPREFIPLRTRGIASNSSRKQSPGRLDSSTIASQLQLQEEQRELSYSLIALIIKSGLLLIALVSSFKLGLASHQRINRNNEISAVLRLETKQLERLHGRFDSLFSIGGKDRLLEEQDQLIDPRSRRIIWR